MQRQLLIETIKRTKGGAFVYAPLWFIAGVLSGFSNRHLSFFIINMLILSTAGFIRVLSYTYLQRTAHIDFARARILFLPLILVGPLDFGIVGALTIFKPEYFSDLRNPIFLISSGIAGTGIMTTAIDKYIRTYFGSAIITPILIATILVPTSENMMVAGLGIIFILYIFSAATHIGDDFRKSSDSQARMEQKAAELELMSNTDPLTALKNRRYFESHYAAEWNRAWRNKTPLSILIIDLDHFKPVNDTYGHDVGDHCLRQIGLILAAQLMRSGDFTARYGGEEFVVLMSNTDLSGAAILADRIRAAIRDAEFTVDGKIIHLTCSIGGSSVIPSGHDSKSLIKTADALLYRAKESGRDRALLDTPDGATSSSGTSAA